MFLNDSNSLLSVNSVELSKLVDNFAAIIQSGENVLLSSAMVFHTWCFSPL